jgi:hypothetical protein
MGGVGGRGLGNLQFLIRRQIYAEGVFILLVILSFFITSVLNSENSENNFGRKGKRRMIRRRIRRMILEKRVVSITLHLSVL